MATIFRIYCDRCDDNERIEDSIIAYGKIDEKNKGKTIPEGYIALKKDDRYICLPHPCETSTLNSYGYTWDKAYKEKIIYSVTYKICMTCGELNKEILPREQSIWLIFFYLSVHHPLSIFFYN